MNREIFEFIYINHDELLAISTKDKKVNCMLNFSGDIIRAKCRYEKIT